MSYATILNIFVQKVYSNMEIHVNGSQQNEDM